MRNLTNSSTRCYHCIHETESTNNHDYHDHANFEEAVDFVQSEKSSPRLLGGVFVWNAFAEGEDISPPHEPSKLPIGGAGLGGEKMEPEKEPQNQTCCPLASPPVIRIPLSGEWFCEVCDAMVTHSGGHGI